MPALRAAANAVISRVRFLRGSIVPTYRMNRPRQAVPRAHASSRARSAIGPEHRARRFVHDRDAIGRHTVQPQQIAPRAVRHGDDRRAPAGSPRASAAG